MSAVANKEIHIGPKIWQIIKYSSQAKELAIFIASSKLFAVMFNYPLTFRQCKANTSFLWAISRVSQAENDNDFCGMQGCSSLASSSN